MRKLLAIAIIILLSGCSINEFEYETCDVDIRVYKSDYGFTQINGKWSNVSITEDGDTLTFIHGENSSMESVYDKRQISYACFIGDTVVIGGERSAFPLDQPILNESDDFEVYHTTNKDQYSVGDVIIIKTSINMINSDIEVDYKIGGLQNFYKFNYIETATEIVEVIVYSISTLQDNYSLQETYNVSSDSLETYYWTDLFIEEGHVGKTLQLSTSFYYERVKYTYSTLLDIKIN